MNYWIWYSTLKTLTLKQKRELLNNFDTPQRIYNLTFDEINKISFLNKKNKLEIFNNKNNKLIEKYEKYIKKENIKIISIYDKNYPKKLKRIYDPPITIFAKGNINLLNSISIAIIGCRKASEYGIRMAKKISYEISKEKIVVISGLARGIDSYAHIGCLNANERTIAVLGSGIDYIYPKENVKLYKEIIEKDGLIISEYLPGEEPKAENFPERNRIISALSEGILVVEAKKKSGTMITVDFGLEQGKTIYVIPGNINSLNSEGTNELLKEGAKLVSRKEDILEDFRRFLLEI